MSAVFSPLRRIVTTGRGPFEIAEFGDGPAVIALHGAMGGWDQSLILARLLAPPGYRCLGLSRPGYLGTPLSVGVEPEEQADAVAEVMDRLGLSGAVVMAVSGGGPTALHFALRHPGRCRGLVLASTCGGVMDTRIPLGFRIMTALARVSPLMALLRRKAQTNVDAAARRSIPGDALRERTLADPVAGPLLRELLSGVHDGLRERLPGTANDIRVTRQREYRLERIAVPTLVIHGTADRVVPFAQHGAKLIERIANAQPVVIEGGEHVAIFTHRDRIAPAVARFLAETAG
jgi:pimeloyl-ACP methyl ester carboxylesterase